jgi:hypothetical protein
VENAAPGSIVEIENKKIRALYFSLSFGSFSHDVIIFSKNPAVVSAGWVNPGIAWTDGWC